ncbi:arylsulfatase [Streptomyces xanthophaeus]|uniref:arylsulfatase n=1 Tax=Streptomyces xanthophaeus TaxID=67385 RepID=UPI00386B6F1B|nr:arylsulfatase [Streptomyces xanthophaeus]WST64340.1 arylsulfatase [Streptomyces xanthophaeus]
MLADDLGYGELGAYGQKLIATPRLDRLATEGLRFTDAYATAAVCAPSRASLLTGLHTGHSPVCANPAAAQGSLTSADTTFAEVLRARGYRTAVIGKWGFGPEAAGQDSHPAARGFEEFYGYIDHSHAHQYYPQYLWHNDAKETIAANAGGAKAVYAPDLLEQRALDFIDDNAAQPFLLLLTPNVPHAPSDVPDTSAYAGRTWSASNKGHAAQVSSFDSLVGKVVDRLRALGLEQDTVLLVTSDNGPHEEGGVDPDLFDANGPLRGYKRNLYEGGVRVPLIAWGPGRVRQGASNRITSLADVLPTLAELAGAPAPTDVDGLSAAPLLGGSADSARHGHRRLTPPGAPHRAAVAAPVCADIGVPDRRGRLALSRHDLDRSTPPPRARSSSPPSTVPGAGTRSIPSSNAARCRHQVVSVGGVRFGIRLPWSSSRVFVGSPGSGDGSCGLVVISPSGTAGPAGPAPPRARGRGCVRWPRTRGPRRGRTRPPEPRRRRRSPARARGNRACR